MRKEDENILGVDLDGVCCDYYKRIREIAAEWKGCDLETLEPDVDRDLRNWGIASQSVYNELHKFAVLQRQLYSSLDEIPGSGEWLRKLATQYRIRLISYRLFVPGLHRVTIEQTVEWLEANNIPYWDLCFVKNKQEVYADIYVEDDPRSVQSLREAGKKVICFANCRNRDLPPPRVGQWEEVYHLLTGDRDLLSA
jgi:5'(3')-deoxyribonucleotidase